MTPFLFQGKCQTAPTLFEDERQKAGRDDRCSLRPFSRQATQTAHLLSEILAGLFEGAKQRIRIKGIHLTLRGFDAGPTLESF